MTSNAPPSTAAIYNKAADRWVRHGPQSLSDFTGRPVVFDLCGNVNDKTVLDLGCGEGYCARALIENGAAKVFGIDISEKMVTAAESASLANDQFNYSVGDVTDLSFESDQFDLSIGVFVYNYLNIKDMITSFKECYRVLKPGGDFVFSVPHPAFPLAQPSAKKPFFFNFEGKGYFTARDIRTFGEIYRRDGQSLPVEMTHKLFEDYMSGLAEAGFNQIPIIRELGVLSEHLEIDKEFFEPLWDKPLHLAFKTTKPK